MGALLPKPLPLLSLTIDGLLSIENDCYRVSIAVAAPLAQQEIAVDSC